MQTRTCVSGALALALLIWIGGCQKAAEKPAAKQYPIRGEVVALDAAQKKVTLDHEDIPGLMKGMEMEFEVADGTVVDGLAAGDKVEGQLEVRDGERVITKLTKP